MLRYDIRTGVKKIKTKLDMSIQTTALIIGGLGFAIALPFVAHAASNNTTASSSWHLGYYNPSGRALSFASAKTGDGLASFNFTNQSNTALLTTDQKAKNPTLLGDITGKTVSLTYTINNATPASFTYYGQGTPSNPCGTPASARLFFETSNAGGFDSTHYWWSNPASSVLDNGQYTISAKVDPSNWSDWNGQFGNTAVDGFAAAASNVTNFGLSFGGGCFFENGVGTTDGSGTFTLNSYNVL